MSAQELFEMMDYCRRTGLAESTCGRRTVNDSKLISRLFELARPRRRNQSVAAASR
jgi:hypothetical protein